MIVSTCVFSFAQTKGKYTNLFDEAKIKSDIKYISDDKFEGRAPEISMATGMKISNAPKLPAYKSTDEFAKAPPRK